MIYVFGSLNVDLVTRVARLPAAGETVLGETYSLHPGGKGANQALAARRAGAEVAFVGAVGRDAFAEIGLSLLKEAGVDISRVVRVDAPTGLASIAVDEKGENLIVVASGANRLARVQQIEDLPIGAGDLLLMQFELPTEDVAAAAFFAKSRKATVVLNAAPFQRVFGSLLDAFKDQGTLEYLIVNEGEGEALAAELEPLVGVTMKDGMDLTEIGCSVMVTRGGQGTTISAGAFVSHIDAHPVSVVDTTAAGDTFAGVFAAAFARGAKLDAAVREANVAAALACTREGAQPSMPSRAEIDRALAETKI